MAHGANDPAHELLECGRSTLPVAARVALILHRVGGLPSARIAAVFGVPTRVMRQRLTRAEARLRSEPPGDGHEGVLEAIDLIFAEGTTGPHPEDGLDLATEAIELSRMITAHDPDDCEARAQLATMLYVHARRQSPEQRNHTVVALSDSDRAQWDRRLIAEADFLLARCRRDVPPGPRQMRAEIQSLHARARSAAETDWAAILAWSDRLMPVGGSTTDALERVLALAKVDGPETALAASTSAGFGADLTEELRAHLTDQTRQKLR